MNHSCVHCQKAMKGRSPGRGLCWKCYRNPAVRVECPRRKPGPKTGEDAEEYPDDEPTEEELEAIIAEQRRCLPAWWATDARKQRETEYERKLYQLVKCT